MISLKVILLFLILNMDNVRAIEKVSLVMEKSAKVKNEDLLIEFMTDLKKFSFTTLRHHRLLVLGKEENILQAAKVILASGTPYFISSEADAMVLPPNFGADSVVLFFIDGFTDFEIDSAFAKLPSDYACRVLIISMMEDRTYESTATAILSAVKMKLRNVKFAHFDGQVIKIYGRILNASCKQEIKLMNKWVPKKGFIKNDQVLGHNLVLNERGCPMLVSTFQILPTMILREDENKSLHISGGVEGDLVTTIAKYLNMVPVVKVPSVEERMWIERDGTVVGIIGEVSREEASFGIGQIRPTVERTRLVDFTKPYGFECMVWTVPNGFKYIDSVLTSEFPLIAWTMVALSVFLCCGLVYIIPRLNMGWKSSLNSLDVLAMTLNYAIPHRPNNLLLKLCFLVYLNYARVICTAYSASLSSILTTARPAFAIVDEDGILAAGLHAAGAQGSFEILAEQITPNSAKAELINSYEVITSVDEALKRVVDRQDIAYLRHRSTIDYISEYLSIQAQKLVDFHHLSDCVISYHSSMVTPKGSRLTGKINHVMLRLNEAGLHNYLKKPGHAIQSLIKTVKHDNHTLSRLGPIFLLYLYCLVPAFFAFATELIVSRLKPNWFTR